MAVLMVKGRVFWNKACPSDLPQVFKEIENVFIKKPGAYAVHDSKYHARFFFPPSLLAIP